MHQDEVLRRSCNGSTAETASCEADSRGTSSRASSQAPTTCTRAAGTDRPAGKPPAPLEPPVAEPSVTHDPHDQVVGRLLCCAPVDDAGRNGKIFAGITVAAEVDAAILEHTISPSLR